MIEYIININTDAWFLRRSKRGGREELKCMSLSFKLKYWRKYSQYEQDVKINIFFNNLKINQQKNLNQKITFLNKNPCTNED